VLKFTKKSLLFGLAAVGIATVGATHPVAASAALAIQVLEHRNAHSPVYAKLREVAGNRHRRTVHRRHPRPERFHVVVVDGDRHHHRSLATDRVLRRALSAGRWVLLLDPNEHDAHALFAHIGIKNNKPSAAYLVRKEKRGRGAGAVRVIEIPRLAGRNRRALRRQQVRYAARVLHRAISGSARSAAGIGSDDGSVPNPPASVDYVRYYWTTAGTWDVAKGDSGTTQTANWTVNHNINVFYDANNIASGDRQLIEYRVDAQFEPGTLLHRSRERKGWWTGAIDLGVKPAATIPESEVSVEEIIKRLLAGRPLVPNNITPPPDVNWVASAPANTNGQEQYSAGSEFSVGLSGSTPGASYNWNTSKTYTVDDWTVFALADQQTNPRWRFASNNPCGPDGDKAKCFAPPPTGALGYGFPREPNNLSRSPIQVHASAVWATKQVEDRNASVLVEDQVTALKTVCDKDPLWYLPGATRCREGDIHRESRSHALDAQQLTFDLGAAIPTPVERITFDRDQVTAGDTVRATVRLARTPRFDTTVDLSANNDNAAVVPDVKVPAGQREVTFDIATNDNRLNPGQSVTTAITARYRGSVQGQLRITAPNK
jgi:hypothetical protein